MTHALKEPFMAVDVQAYKESMAHWATGVSIVTAVAPDENLITGDTVAGDGRAVGITVSSLTSLSIDPPEVLISVSKKLYTHGVILATRRFAATILHAGQVEIGMRFAGMVPEVEDRFAGIETMRAVTGCPILVDSLAWVDCVVKHVFDGEDHTIFVGEVMAAGSTNEGEPLLYYKRKWRLLAAAD
jgi:flavin reductase (DIM6/NTAB) family NADH-FMN oxidoreductase RutF